MKIKRVVSVVALSLGMLALTACSTTGRHTGAPVSDAVPAGATAGYDSTNGWNGMGGSNTIPGANQKYYFDFNSNTVHQEYYPSIGAQAKYLSSHPSSAVRLEGNTDIRGSREYNMALGWRRAKAVKSVLLQDGASPRQITTFSWGAEKPAATGADEVSYAKNRRVDLKFTSK